MREDSDTLPLDFRTFVFSKAYHGVLEYFAHWGELSQEAFEEDFRSLISDMIEIDDRFSFDMLMMELLARLKNGHTWFSDNWLNRLYNQALPIEFGHVSGKWIVLKSSIDGIERGSVIEAINNLPFEEFYISKRNKISASSEREARSRFSEIYYFFPRESVLNIGMKEYTLKREKSSYFVSKPLEGYWLEKDRTALIRIRQFSKSIEEDAIAFVKEFFDSKRLIIDVRGNNGGATPIELVRYLMDHEFGFWRESTPANLGLLKFYGDFVRSNRSSLSESILDKLSITELFSTIELSWAPESMEPREHSYDGELYILTDRYCRSAGEDFVLPFKVSGRATIVGETTMGTSGQPYTHNFKNGMQLFIGTKRVYYPDGSRFEGVGIHPDVMVKTTIEDIADDFDPVLEYCLEQVD